MNTILKNFYLATVFTLLIPLILCILDPFLYGFDVSRYLLDTFSMNISLVISAVLLGLVYCCKFKCKNTNSILNTILTALFSLSIGLVFLNIVSLPLLLRVGLWVLVLIGISYYFKNILVNIILTIVFIWYFISSIFTLPILDHIIDLPASYVKLSYLSSAIVALFISNIPFISKKYPNFSLTYKVISLYIIVQNLLGIFMNTSFDIIDNYAVSTYSDYTPPLVALSMIPTVLALLSFTTFVINKKKLSSYLKLEVCLAILLSIVMIFVINFPSSYSSLIISGLYFIALIITMFYLSYSFKNPYLLLLTNIILLYCLVVILTIVTKTSGISGLSLIIPFIIYLITSIFLTLYLKRLQK